MIHLNFLREGKGGISLPREEWLRRKECKIFEKIEVNFWLFEKRHILP
jgi:hypothetical protein